MASKSPKHVFGGTGQSEDERKPVMTMQPRACSHWSTSRRNKSTWAHLTGKRNARGEQRADELCQAATANGRSRTTNTQTTIKRGHNARGYPHRTMAEKVPEPHQTKRTEQKAREVVNNLISAAARRKNKGMAAERETVGAAKKKKPPAL